MAAFSFSFAAPAVSWAVDPNAQAVYADPLAFAAPQSAEGDLQEPGWPRAFDAAVGQIALYQPEVTAWDERVLQGRLAIVVTPNDDPDPIYGELLFSAATQTTRDRMVRVFDLRVDQIRFPAAGDDLAGQLSEAVFRIVPTHERFLPLDRVTASLDRTQRIAELEAAELQNTPPAILVARERAILAVLAGDPVMHEIPGTSLLDVINTQADILLDSRENLYYFATADAWLVSNDLFRGRWEWARSVPPGLDRIPDDHARAAAAKQVPANPQQGPAPQVIVSTQPAELITIDGEPGLTPIPGTRLLFVGNSQNDLFKHTGENLWFVLLSGRWFSTQNLDQGPWEPVAANALPDDFAMIPWDSPKASVLVSVPGTPEAEEALIIARIPQTAVVRRDAINVTVSYDGQPQFQPIENTELVYATNTSYEVVGYQNRYYLAYQGAWFTSNAPTGPWVLADSIPGAIYTIPPSSPLYHTTYIQIYDATPQYVTYGYLPGYLGTYVSNGTVVYGTGYRYQPYISRNTGRFYGWPVTWGGGVVYNLLTGGYGYRTNYYTPFQSGYVRAGFNPTTGYVGRNVARYTPYTAWDRSIVRTANTIVNIAQTTNITNRRVENISFDNRRAAVTFVGRDGQVYRRSGDDWRRFENGRWTETQAPRDVARNFAEDRDFARDRDDRDRNDRDPNRAQRDDRPDGVRRVAANRSRDRNRQDRDDRDPNDRDRRDPSDRDPRDPNARDPRDPNARDPRNPTARDPRDPNAGEPRDPRGPRDPMDRDPNRGPRDPREPRDPNRPDAPRPGEPRDPNRPDAPRPDDGPGRPDAPRGDNPRPDAPRGDNPRPDAPRGDSPRPDAPRPDAPRPDAPRGDNPRPDNPGANPGTNPNNPGANNPGDSPNRPGAGPNRPGAGPNRPGASPNNPGVNPNGPGPRPGRDDREPDDRGADAPPRADAPRRDLPNPRAPETDRPGAPGTPGVNRPDADRPDADRPAADRPTGPGIPGLDRPNADRPNADRPGADRPDVNPGADRPGTPGADRPGTPGADRPDRPGANRPGLRGGDRPNADGPNADRPGADRPSADRPGADRPGADRTGADRPGVPSADRPGVPGADRPGVPGADRPGAPNADRPAVPGADRPTNPNADRPGAPGAGRPNADPRSPVPGRSDRGPGGSGVGGGSAGGVRPSDRDPRGPGASPRNPADRGPGASDAPGAPNRNAGPSRGPGGAAGSGAGASGPAGDRPRNPGPGPRDPDDRDPTDADRPAAPGSPGASGAARSGGAGSRGPGLGGASGSAAGGADRPRNSGPGPRDPDRPAGDAPGASSRPSADLPRRDAGAASPGGPRGGGRSPSGVRPDAPGPNPVRPEESMRRPGGGSQGPAPEGPGGTGGSRATGGRTGQNGANEESARSRRDEGAARAAQPNVGPSGGPGATPSSRDRGRASSAGRGSDARDRGGNDASRDRDRERNQERERERND